MQEKLLSSCRGKGGGRHGSKFAVEGLVQEGLLQFLQGGEFAFVEASEVLGFYAQVVGGLLAVISAGIAQRAGGGEGQQKLCGLMQGSQLPRRWPCCEGLLDTLQIRSGPGCLLKIYLLPRLLDLAVRRLYAFEGG